MNVSRAVVRVASGLERLSRARLLAIVIGVLLLEFIALAVWFRPIVDNDYYDDLAVNLLDGFGYVSVPGGAPVFWLAPAYPFLLAAIFFLFGRSAGPVIVVQVALYLGFLYLLYRTAVTTYSRLVANATVVGAAGYPLLAHYTLVYHPEILFTLVFGILVWVALRAFARPGAGVFLGLGALAGLCSLVKPFFLYYWVFLLALAWRVAGTGRFRIRRLAPIVAGFALAVAPWTARNYLVSGRFLPVATGGGFSLWVGNLPETGGLDLDQLPPGKQRQFQALLVAQIGQLGTAHTIEHDQKLARVALARMISEPSTLRLLAVKALRLWFRPYSREHGRYAALMVILHVPVLAGALATLWRCRFAGRGLVASLLIYFQVVYTLTSPTVRYVVPLVPYLILTTAVGLEAWAAPRAHAAA